MKALEDRIVGIVGLGLMGGALARALSRLPDRPARLLGFDTDGETRAAALRDGVIDEAPARVEEVLGRADLVFLCLSPSALIRFLGERMGDFKAGALLTDIAGIKGAVVRAVEKNLRGDLDFIPGHPMAGSEKGGYAHSGGCDFRGKNYLLCPLPRNRPENLDFLRGLIIRLGFGRITCVSPEEHDRKIAFTSQLCHVIAAALIHCEADREITRFGGGSFEGLTRIAMLNAPLWTELFIENRGELLRRIEQFEGSLSHLKSLIAGEETAGLLETLSLIRERRGGMS